MRLKELRNTKNLSGRALSDLSGVPLRTIEDIERFDRCKVDTAIKIADALHVTLDELCRDISKAEEN
jgi:Helix-turn-helix.